MLQMAMRASMQSGEAQSAGFAAECSPSGRPTAFPISSGATSAANVTLRNDKETECAIGSGFELVYRRKPSAGDEDLLVTHVVIRGPWECSCPLKHAAIWMLGWERGVLADVSTSADKSAAIAVPT